MVTKILLAAGVWVLAIALVGGAVPADRSARSAPSVTGPAPVGAGSALALLAGSAPPGASRGAESGLRQSGAVSGAAHDDAALLKQYCLTCHNERTRQGGLVLDVELSKVAADRERWEKVVRKLRTGMMPPSGAPRPPREQLDTLAASLEGRLDGAVDAAASLGTPALHRLNRTEYANAIRDLLDLEVDVAPLLPADGSSEGFDNIAEALSVSPSLIQGYVSAALKISRLAVGDRTMAPSQAVYTAPAGLAQDRHIEGLPLGTRGGMIIRHTFPLDAEYEFTIGGGGPGGGGAGGGADVTIDGARVTAQNTRRFRIPVTAGPHTIGAAMLDRQRGAGVDDAYSDFRAANNGFAVGGGVQSIAITGPFNPTGAGDTPSRRLIFSCSPAGPAETACAQSILSRLARHAYRGEVTPADIETLMSFYRQGRQRGDFETGIQEALARILVAPRFLYRVEEQPANLADGTVYRVGDTDLASRLSFFLWSSIPDQELLDLAAKNRLRDPATLERQVRRMVADRRSEAFVRNFAGQWLYLRELANIQTDAPGFDANLRQSFRRETELLVDGIVREDRSVLELLDADYTFVDERLARHYQIPDVRGSHFRRVSLASDSPRRGLMGHGSMLTVTSVATRTSPVMRGKWILENLLGAPPPQPPPGVETNLEEGEESAKTTTLRQRLERHRATPVCASCHNIMDPIGFALENFDLIGAWRDMDGPSKIDANGRLADGTALSGPADLRRAVLSRSEVFVTTMTEKLFIYALGRPVHAEDMPMIRAVVRRAAKDGYRFSALLNGVIESDAFQKRVKKS